MAEEKPPGNPETPDESDGETEEKGTEEELRDAPQSDDMTLVR